MASNKNLPKKARRIKMLLLDVDGVMTDGGIYYTAEGVELKRFNAQDGFGIVRAREHGLKVGIISGRKTPIVATRAKELKVDELFESAEDKVGALREIQRKYSFKDEEFAFMGDDMFDIPLLKAVGLSAAPGNARPEVRKIVDVVTKSNGGDGAVRELIELVIRLRAT